LFVVKNSHYFAKVQVMFLNYKTSDGHKMATAYCGLQKSLRTGSEDRALYWAGQIGKSMKGAKGYPNALKKRLCQNALEDAASWTFASRLLVEVPTGPKLEFEQLIPWVRGLASLSKTHSTAWLNRVAAQRVYEGTTIMNRNINVEDMSEVEFASACLQEHSLGDIETLRSACLGDGDLAIKLYKFVNSDPLVFHAWQMHQRRAELRERNIQLNNDNTDVDLSDIFTKPQELPLEWFDKHTKERKKMGRGYAHFFEIMELHPSVYEREESENGSNACVRGGNDPYESEAKDLYLDFKLNGSEARVRHLLDPSLLLSKTGKKRDISSATTNSEDDVGLKEDVVVLVGGTDVKKMRHDAEERDDDDDDDDDANNSSRSSSCIVNNIKAASSPSGVTRDIDLFGIPDSTGLIGFKNFTVVGVLKRLLPGTGLQVGDRVFIKIGESYTKPACLQKLVTT
jgi:hypothetical protein